MYQVTIADDEEKICYLIEESIRWNELDLKLLDTCYNGEELYQSVRKNKPDIIITDICMPGLNGIDSIRKMRESGFGGKIVIISGHRQFEYAYNALKYSVDDYLLKPIDERELNHALRKIIAALDKSDAAAGTHRDSNALQNHFMTSLVYKLDQQQYSDIGVVNDEFGTRFVAGCFMAVHIKVNLSANMSDDCEIFTIQKKIQDICLHALSGVCAETIVSISTMGVVIGANYPEESRISVEKCIQRLPEHVSSALELFKGISFVIGAGREYLCPKGLLDSLEEAIAAVKCHIVLHNQPLLQWEELQARYCKDSVPITYEQERGFMQNFEACDCNGFMRNLNYITNSGYGAQPIQLYSILEQVSNLFFRAVEQYFHNYEKNDYLRKEITFCMWNAQSPVELRDNVCQLLCSVMDQFRSSRQVENRKPIRVAQEYIVSHYSEALKLETVAEIVFLSPAYFSSLFKEETGRSFVNYLTDYRLEKAKDMLRGSRASVQEIASSVGYSDQRYFSKLFRQTVGIKPTEYRKLYS